MNVQPVNVNPPVEPPLFPGGALSLTIEAMLDPDELTVLFVVRGWDVGAGKLIALWSSSPVGYEHLDEIAERARSEWFSLLREHSGPF